MIIAKCDFCKKEMAQPQVMIRGWMPLKTSGILLPAAIREFHFCGKECFENWAHISDSKQASDAEK